LGGGRFGIRENPGEAGLKTGQYTGNGKRERRPPRKAAATRACPSRLRVNKMQALPGVYFLAAERQSLQMPPTSVRETVTCISKSRAICSLSCS
jgi:hypothetical protein